MRIYSAVGKNMYEREGEGTFEKKIDLWCDGISIDGGTAVFIGKGGRNVGRCGTVSR